MTWRDCYTEVRSEAPRKASSGDRLDRMNQLLRDALVLATVRDVAALTTNHPRHASSTGIMAPLPEKPQSNESSLAHCDAAHGNTFCLTVKSLLLQEHYLGR